MTYTSEITKSEHKEPAKDMPHFDLVATGVVTGLLASAITQTGRGVVGILAKNPLVIFGVGFAAGYFARKYRKGIILSANKVADQGKDFVTRQKKHIDDLLTESDED